MQGFLFSLLIMLYKFLAIALICFVAFSALSQNNNNDTVYAQKLNERSLQLIDSGRYSEAMRLSEQALAIAERFPKDVQEKNRALLDIKASAYHHIGVIYFYQGEYSKALESYLKEMKTNEILDDKTGIAGLHNNIGILYKELGNYPEALKSYNAFLKFMEEKKDTLRIASAYLNIGAVYESMGYDEKDPNPAHVQYSKAFENYQKALKLFEESKDSLYIPLCLMNIGNIYGNEKKYSQAIENYKKSLAVLEKIGDRQTAAICYNNIGSIYIETGDYTEAKNCIEKGLALAKEIGSRDDVKESYSEFSKLYKEQGDYKKAYEYFKLFTETKDSIFNEESSQQIAEMQTKYETEKKEQQITLLNKDKELQEAQLNRQKIIIWSVAGGLLIVLILSVFIFRERKKSEKLLLNILPAETAKELKRIGKATARHYESVTVMFTDFKDFTTIAEKLSAEELVSELDFIFRKFDEIISKYDIEKIKTIGDAYMCASGLPTPNANHAEQIVKAGIEIQQWMKEQNNKWTLRMGIHSGPVTAGVVGDKKFAYDIWGDTVNTASRMESSGEPGKINISGTTYELLHSSHLAMTDKEGCSFIHRGKIPAKNKGEIEMYFVEN